MELCAFKRNNFILYKLIPCLIITMFAIMCLYGSSVYAVSFENDYYSLDDSSGSLIMDILYNNNHYTVNLSNSIDIAKYPYFYIVYDKNSDYGNICFSSKPFYCSLLNNGEYEIKTDTNYYHGSLQLKTWGDFAYNPGSLTDNTFSFKPSAISFTSNDILDNNGNVVFQAPPQVQETQAIIAEQVGEVEMNKTLQEILGILPVVIVVLVGLIAIRKGIQFLMARMKKA